MTGHRGREYSRLSWPNRGRWPAREAASEPPSPSPSAPRSREVRPADDDEERRPRPPPQRRPGRPRRRRQDDARRAAPLSSRRHPAARPGRRRHGPPRLRARGAEAQGVAEPRGRDVRARRRPGSRSSTRPATRTSSPRSSRGFAAADGALFVVDASAGVEAGPRDGRRPRPLDRPGRVLLHQQVRPRERATRRRRSTRSASRFGNKIAPLHLAIGKGEAFSGYVDLVHRKAYALRGRQGGRDPDPGRARRRDRHAAATSSSRPPPRPTTT